LIQPAVREGDEVGDDDVLESESDERKSGGRAGARAGNRNQSSGIQREVVERQRHVSLESVTRNYVSVTRPLTVTVSNPPLPAPAIHLATRIKFMEGAMAHMSVPAGTVSKKDICDRRSSETRLGPW
jgi:hypothetical protein